MSPTRSLERTLERSYSLRPDQTLSTERRVALSQVHTDQIVASVREHCTAWQAAIDAKENRMVVLGHSFSIQQAIADIMRRKAWSPAVEKAVHDILGGSAGFNIAMGQTYAERQPVVRPLERSSGAVAVDDWSTTDDEDELG